MREIKFRLWDRTEKEMIYLDKVGDRQRHTFGIRKDGNLYYYNLQNGSGGDEYILMQYTGLKDKNGKEICEGDILRLANGKIRTVFKVKGGFAIESLDMDIGKHGKISYCPIESLADEQNAGYIESQAEVIGNICDNPELLESEGNDVSEKM